MSSGIRLLLNKVLFENDISHFKTIFKVSLEDIRKDVKKICEFCKNSELFLNR